MNNSDRFFFFGLFLFVGSVMDYLSYPTKLVMSGVGLVLLILSLLDINKHKGG